MPDRTFVIAGASLAGATAAETLRAEGFDGRLVLIGAETERPYERPPLSKDYLRGETERDGLYVHADGFYEEQEIELRLGTTVAGIDVNAAEVELAGGERLGFDSLLIATGASPRRLDVPGGEKDGVHYMREAGDSDALREALGEASSVVVVGSGWIGSEVAASVRTMGRDVTVVDPLEFPLERVLGPDVGAVYRDIHTDHGVRMLLGQGVERIEGGDHVEAVVTSAGTSIDCDLVVIGVGAVPRTELAVSGGLAVDNGVLVDERLETAAPGVFAAGDVANANHRFYGHRIRTEHWANAIAQGKTAAHNMLGREVSHDDLPYFFSDQYEVGMEYTGLPESWDRFLYRGDPASREFIAFWLEGERVVAGMNVNVWDVADSIKALIRWRTAVDPDELSDPSVPLDGLARINQETHT